MGVGSYRGGKEEGMRGGKSGSAKVPLIISVNRAKVD